MVFVVITHSRGDIVVCLVQPPLVEHVEGLQIGTLPAQSHLIILCVHFEPVEYVEILAVLHEHGLALIQHFEIVIIVRVIATRVRADGLVALVGRGS